MPLLVKLSSLTFKNKNKWLDNSNSNGNVQNKELNVVLIMFLRAIYTNYFHNWTEKGYWLWDKLWQLLWVSFLLLKYVYLFNVICRWQYSNVTVSIWFSNFENRFHFSFSFSFLLFFFSSNFCQNPKDFKR